MLFSRLCRNVLLPNSSVETLNSRSSICLINVLNFINQSFLTRKSTIHIRLIVCEFQFQYQKNTKLLKRSLWRKNNGWILKESFIYNISLLVDDKSLVRGIYHLMNVNASFKSIIIIRHFEFAIRICNPILINKR